MVFAEDIERYWLVIAYIPTIMALVVGVGYFIEKKLLIRKPSEAKVKICFSPPNL